MRDQLHWAKDNPRAGLMYINKNEALVLHAISVLDEATRRSISESTSLSLVSVSAALSSLEEAKCIRYNSRSKEGGGRPTHFYSFAPEMASFLGISINPDSFRAVVIGADGSLMRDELFPLVLSADSSAHIDEIVNQVSDQVRIITDNGSLRYLGVGITLPGVTDSQKGVWVEGFQVTGISHINIREMFQRRINLPVCIEDPARAAAFYELRHGAAVGVENFVLLFLGYGVGAGIVFNSTIFHGAEGLAGEVGHLVVDPNGYRCSCGDVGCFETVASTKGIERIVMDRLNEGVVSTLRDRPDLPPKNVSLEDVNRAAKSGDRLALSVLNEVGRHIGNACAMMVKLLNPSLVIISGEVAELREFMEHQINSTIIEHVMPSMIEKCRVEFARYELHDEAYGVALMAIELHWAEKKTHFDGNAKKKFPIEASLS